MAEKACVKRLQKEYRALCKVRNLLVAGNCSSFEALPDTLFQSIAICNTCKPGLVIVNYAMEPVSHVVARPSPNDILEWHYVLEGSEGTPFAGGFYYGKIKFPPEYPFKPPGISMTTPNGRFMTQKKICLSMSDFHPESWNPMWSVSSILTGLLSFMMDNSPTTGSVSTTVAEKEKLAKASLAFNCKNPTFRKLFPEYVEKYEQQQLPSQPVPEQLSSMPAGAEKSRPLLEEHDNSTKDEVNRVKPLKDIKNQQRKSVPTWLLLLLVSIFGVVMALPLLQL
ncbi:hypothetical protein RDI58_009536 [Solanum bulbocastanum]|uniref:UBC core domain-containing protein n=1 Tax=Solanum bulbocastanum TaxID=147425 RepID=A0AAN8U2Q7_SOLBU